MNPEPRPPRVSMRDIARRLGVSHVTVSLALRDHPRLPESTRRRIRETAEEMGYKPDPLLAALANYRRDKSTAPINAALAWINAWADPDKLRSYREFDFYWKGATAAAEKLGYRLEEFRMDEKHDPQRLHQILSTRGIRGLLLPPQRPHPDWDAFPWSEYSVIRFGRSLNHPRSHVITADQVANTMLAFQEIRNRGYRRIGFVTDETDLRYRGHLFEGGYLTAQRLVDDSERVPVFVRNDYSPKQQKPALAAWLKEQRVDAIITNQTDLVPMLASIGVRVPDDVALAGTSVLDTNIDAGIDQHPEEIGRAAVLMLNSLINDAASGIPSIFRQLLVEGAWVDGSSLPDRRTA